MAARVAVELEELLDRMEKGSVPSDSRSRSDVIGRVAKLFGVKEDEVADHGACSIGPHAALCHARKIAPSGIDPAFE